jgi:hypothetical protein
MDRDNEITWVYCVIKRTIGGVFVFLRCIFLIKKLLVHVPHAVASDRRPHH